MIDGDKHRDLALAGVGRGQVTIRTGNLLNSAQLPGRTGPV